MLAGRAACRLATCARLGRAAVVALGVLTKVTVMNANTPICAARRFEAFIAGINIAACTTAQRFALVAQPSGCTHVARRRLAQIAPFNGSASTAIISKALLATIHVEAIGTDVVFALQTLFDLAAIT